MYAGVPSDVPSWVSAPVSFSARSPRPAARALAIPMIHVRIARRLLGGDVRRRAERRPELGERASVLLGAFAPPCREGLGDPDDPRPDRPTPARGRCTPACRATSRAG